MKNTQTSKNNQKLILSVLIALQIFTLIILGFGAYSINRLNENVDYINRQSFQFNARTNNLKECLKNQDLECPENKYVDSRQFLNVQE